MFQTTQEFDENLIKLMIFIQGDRNKAYEIICEMRRHYDEIQNSKDGFGYDKEVAERMYELTDRLKALMDIEF